VHVLGHPESIGQHRQIVLLGAGADQHDLGVDVAADGGQCAHQVLQAFSLIEAAHEQQRGRLGQAERGEEAGVRASVETVQIDTARNRLDGGL